jgi:hypothetical protein
MSNAGIDVKVIPPDLCSDRGFSGKVFSKEALQGKIRVLRSSSLLGMSGFELCSPFNRG